MWSAYRKCLLALLLGAVCLTVADSAPVIVPPPGGGVIGFPAPCGADGKIPKQSAGVWACGDDTGAGSGAPTDVTYITQTPNATLTGEQALSALTSGLLLNTTGTGVLTIYGGSGNVANQFLRSINAAGGGTHSALTLTDLAQPLGPLSTGLLLNTAGTLSPYGGSGAVANQFLRSVNGSGVGTHSAIGPTDLSFTPMQATYAEHNPMANSSSVTVTALTEAVQGSGAAVDLISSPQIAAGVAGQLLLLPGISAGQTVKFDNVVGPNGLRLCGNKGSTIVGLNGEKPLMVFNPTLNVWEELICPSLQKAYNTDRTIYTATDAATAVQIGSDAANHTKFYGSTIEGVCSGGACDQVLNARTGKTLQTTYSDAGTPCTSMTDTGVITYSNNCKPRKSVDFGASSFETDGTVCTDPVSGTVNGSKMQVISCTDPGADTPALEVTMRMPDSWDGGPVTVQTDWFSASNLSTQHVDTDWNGVCVRSGDVKPAPTLTNVVAAVTTFGNQANDERMTTTGAITLNGTCAGGARVYLRGRILAATNAVMTNVRFLGAKLEYAVNAFSD